MPEINQSEWNKFIETQSHIHLLQKSEWAELKAAFGWTPTWIVAGDSGAQILFRSLPLGFSIAYIPKGPVGENWEKLWPEIDKACKKRRAIFLKLEQDAWDGEGVDLIRQGFKESGHSIQPRRTLTLDISLEDDEILKRMKQKTRYNIRLARKKDVLVNRSEDLEVFSSMMDVTGTRDAFGVHSIDYYQKVFQLFHPAGNAVMLVAEFEAKPLAGIMVFSSGKRAWYFYGASTNEERNRMPTYLLQWEAILWAKEQGCTEYDLWGVPDEDQETLEEKFKERHDELWGVYRFKRGFGGMLKRAEKPFDRVYKPLLYLAYKLFMRDF